MGLLSDERKNGSRWGSHEISVKMGWEHSCSNGCPWIIGRKSKYIRRTHYTSVKNIKNVWRCRDNRTAKSMKTSRDDGINSSVYNTILHIFPHNTCIMRKVCRVLYTELFYAIIPACFHTFCCSVIPTSPYIFNVFYTCLPHF